MRAWWLLLPIVIVLAISAWISGMDPIGDASTTWLLWTATVTAATFLVFSVRAGE
jgi:hypothetical protein